MLAGNMLQKKNQMYSWVQHKRKCTIWLLSVVKMETILIESHEARTTNRRCVPYDRVWDRDTLKTMSICPGSKPKVHPANVWPGAARSFYKVIYMYMAACNESLWEDTVGTLLSITIAIH